MPGMESFGQNAKEASGKSGKSKRVGLVALAIVLIIAGFGIRFAYKTSLHFGHPATLEVRLAAETNRPIPEPVTDPIVLAVREATQWMKEGRKEEAVTRVRALAEAGHAEAQRQLGVFYRWGHGVAIDYLNAQYWYQKAIEQGDINAMHNMGLLYFFGQGVPKDYDKAIKFMLPSGNSDSVNSQRFIGWSYLKSGNRNEFLNWMTRASKNGDRYADIILWINGGTYYGPPLSFAEKACTIFSAATSLYNADYCATF